ncbi:helix-turn-helix transcriptional regulator [Leucobacter komagatae]|uniref:HTH luxR-type domain-containing protein n=1 Tax=Leucobacter komagatae TaxID=55969 RepID=A0A0D0H3D9_9MICO|nr:LuxR family transcriptional regulator [Leucobacter komagatae]KIP51670.1 hypothetical protein SD72_14070 [Leucobacter komagatae]
MTMQIETVFRRASLAQTIETLSSGKNILVAAPTGSGRSHLLHEVMRHLSATEKHAELVDVLHPSSAAIVQSAAVETTLLVDSFEHAGLGLVSALATHIAEGGMAIVALDSSNGASLLNASLAEFTGAFDYLSSILDTFHTIELAPLSPKEIEWLLHEYAPTPVTAATAKAIVELAEGRPRWAIDLCELSLAGRLTTFPKPGITSGHFNRRDPQGLRSTARQIGDISPEGAAAAVVLAQLEPLDFAGVEDLVGTLAAHSLRHHGTLFPAADPALLYVPPFLAAALAGKASPPHVEKFERVVQQRLLGKAALGMQLAESELRFFTRAAQTAVVPEGSHRYRDLREFLVQDSVVSLAAFGDEGQARALILRTDTGKFVIDTPSHAMALSVLVTPESGLKVLEQMQPPEDSAGQLEWLYLQTLLRELTSDTDGLPLVAGATPNDSRAQDSAVVLRLWNSTEAIETSLPRLRAIAQNYAGEDLGVLASTLVELDEVWRGCVPAGSWLSDNAPIPRTPMQTSRPLRHVAGAVLLAQSLSAAMSGQFNSRQHEIEEIASRSPLREYHFRWLAHFSAARAALMCGNLSRAKLEWKHLLHDFPRFIPVRLRQYVEESYAALKTVSEEGSGPHPGTEDNLALAVVRYLTGRRPHGHPEGAASRLSSRSLPILRLREAHLSAAEARNPVELSRIADELTDYGLWAPAADAISTAQSIYLSRRTVSGIQTTSERLDDIELRLEVEFPWYRRGSLPANSHHMRLTEREREAAVLAAAGRSNKEIAAMLHCSIRTVESHIAQARAKVGAASRKELADLVPAFSR